MKHGLSIEVFPDKYDGLLESKVSAMRSLFRGIPELAGAVEEVEVHKSAPTGFRMRAEFRAWRESAAGGQGSSPPRVFHAMSDPVTKEAVEVVSYPMGTELMQRLMPRVMEGLQGSEVLRERLFQVNYLTTLSGEALVTVLYHKRLDAQWSEEAEGLRRALGIKALVGRSRKQVVRLPDEATGFFVTERLRVGGREVSYRQVEGSFSQPNAGVCVKMLEFALGATSGRGERDLLELYCGNGNFTVPLAGNFRKVLATEVSKSGVASCKVNLEANGVENVKLARLSDVELTEALNKEREFRRLQDEGIDLDTYDFSTVLVDPPRAGLDGRAAQLVARFDRIVYISCNPETLARDLTGLAATHKVVKFAAFDQFPYTHHLECGALLERVAGEGGAGPSTKRQRVADAAASDE